jgi:hypothetical protein
MTFLLALYAFLLRAYPLEFRRSYEREMSLAFKDLLQCEARNSGAAGMIGLALRVFPDLVACIIREQIGTQEAKQLAKWGLVAMSIVAIQTMCYFSTIAYSSIDVLLGCCLLIGAADPKHLWRWSIVLAASHPILRLSRICLQVESYNVEFFYEFAFIIPAVIFSYFGLATRAFIVRYSAPDAGGMGRKSRFALLCVGCIAVGFSIGSWEIGPLSAACSMEYLAIFSLVLGALAPKPLIPAMLLGFGVPAFEVLMKSTHHQPLKDGNAVLFGWIPLLCVALALAASSARKSLLRMSDSVMVITP